MSKIPRRCREMARVVPTPVAVPRKQVSLFCVHAVCLAFLCCCSCFYVGSDKMDMGAHCVCVTAVCARLRARACVCACACARARVCVRAAFMGSVAFGGAADALMNAFRGDDDTASAWETGANASYASRHNPRNNHWVSVTQTHTCKPLQTSMASRSCDSPVAHHIACIVVTLFAIDRAEEFSRRSTRSAQRQDRTACSECAAQSTPARSVEDEASRTDGGSDACRARRSH